MSEEAPPYLNRTTVPRLSSSNGSVSAGVAASGDAAGSSGSSKQRDRDYCSLTPLVVSHGGGSNSTAMLIGMWRRGVVPDAILFADTGGERPETYDFITEFSAWLTKRGFPAITTVRNEGLTLEQDCLNRKALPSVAFGQHLRGCSERWKIRPINKWLSQWYPAMEAWKHGGKVCKLVGFDAGERHRLKDYGDEKYIVEYPLVAWGWGRKKCVEVCVEHGFTPGKSSCFFCPNMRVGEILRLKSAHPELAQRAVAMERNAELSRVSGLGRDWSWGDLLQADSDQERLFPDYAEEMPCGCYDGGLSEGGRGTNHAEDEKVVGSDGSPVINAAPSHFTPAVADPAGLQGLLVPDERANTNSAQSEASQRQNHRI